MGASGGGAKDHPSSKGFRLQAGAKGRAQKEYEGVTGFGHRSGGRYREGAGSMWIWKVRPPLSDLSSTRSNDHAPAPRAARNTAIAMARR